MPTGPFEDLRALVHLLRRQLDALAVDVAALSKSDKRRRRHPRSTRPLTHRHHDAIVALARMGGTATDVQLRRAIGTYATNVITSLEDRGLIVRPPGARSWRLTALGLTLGQHLLEEDPLR